MSRRDRLRTRGRCGASHRGSRRDRFNHAPDNLSLLQSPSRGVDEPFNLLQRDVQDLYWESIVKNMQQHADAHPNTEFPFSCNILEEDLRCRKDSLQELLLAIRKLREGLVASHRMDHLTVQVYELTIFLSILCENRAQLASTITRLVQDIYPAISVGTAITEVQRLYVGRTRAMLKRFEENTRDMIMCVWMLEPIYARRPGHWQEYLERRLYISQQASISPNTTLTFAHRVFHALRRETYRDLEQVLCADEFTSCIWPRLLVLSLIPLVRQKNEGVLRKAYLQIPLSKEAVAMIQNTQVAGPVRNQVSVEWLESVMLCHAQEPQGKARDILACLGSVLGYDTWDATLQHLAPRVRHTDGAYALAWRA